MTKRQTTVLGCAALLFVSGLGAAAPARAAVIHQVQPGESIQAAVDAAQPGDTIVLAAGTYRQSVRITKANLTLRGAGSETVLKPSTVAGKAGSCAAAGNGICVIGTKKAPLRGVQVRSLTLSGYHKNGIWAQWTDRLAVRKVTAENNGTWGIAQERSTRSVVRGNLVRNNGDAGIFVANTVSSESGATDTMGTVVSDNRLVGNRIGTTIRRVRNLTLQGNEMIGNCAGAFLVGDETVPRAGALKVRFNRVFQNNKYCKATARLPEIQGTGIVLTGTEDTLVEWNMVRGNVGSSPLSGGIVLFKSIVGAAGTDNVIRHNVVLGNGDADLANRDTAGKGNVFSGNVCAASQPAGLC